MATIPTALSTLTVGQSLSAQHMNDVRAWINFLAAPPQCSVYRNAALNITNNTYTAISLDAETYDTDAMHSTGTNPSRVIAKTAGRYLCTAQVTFASNSTGVRQAFVELNAAGTHSGPAILGSSKANATGASRTTTLSIATQLTLAVNDYIELFCHQDTGGALALTTGSRDTFVELLWIGT